MIGDSENDINSMLVRDSVDSLLFLSERIEEYKENYTDEQLINYINEATEEVIHNLTSVVRNIQSYN